MLMLRTLLIFVLIFGLLRWFGRLLFRSAGRSEEKVKGNTGKGRDDYSDITDQKVDDADFEEL